LPIKIKYKPGNLSYEYFDIRGAKLGWIQSTCAALDKELMQHLKLQSFFPPLRELFTVLSDSPVMYAVW